MNYTLHQLKIFAKIAERQSITKAAEDLFLSQPAISIQLKNFQSQFSIPLTEVVGRRLYITDFGMEIAKAAENILNEVYAINYKTHLYQGSPVGRLKTSVVSTGKYVMPYFLSDFMNIHPGIDLVMDVTNKSKVVRSLEENSTDFALVSVLPKRLNVDRIELMENRLFLIGGTVRKIEDTKEANDLFKDLPLIYREEGSATRKAMEQFISEQRFSIRKKIELTSNEAVKQAVIAGLGYSIMPLIGIKNALKNGEVRIVPIKGLPISTSWNMIWLKSKNLSPAAKLFVEYLALEKDKIIREKFGWTKEY